MNSPHNDAYSGSSGGPTRILRVVNDTSLAATIREQAIVLQGRPEQRIYLNIPNTISESIDEDDYYPVIEPFQVARASRSTSVDILESLEAEVPASFSFGPSPEPETLGEEASSFGSSSEPEILEEKVKAHTRVYRGLSRFASRSSTNLAEFSSATKEKLKEFKLSKSKSTFNLPGLLSSPPSATWSEWSDPPPMPALPSASTLKSLPSLPSLQPRPSLYHPLPAPQINTSSVAAETAETKASPANAKPSTPEPSSRWTTARRNLAKRLSTGNVSLSLKVRRRIKFSNMSSSFHHKQAGLSGIAPRHTHTERTSSRHWASTQHPSRPIADTCGSPAGVGRKAMPSSETSLSPQSPRLRDPVTSVGSPSPKTVRSHTSEFPASSPTPKSSHVFTPVKSAASHKPIKSSLVKVTPSPTGARQSARDRPSRLGAIAMNRLPPSVRDIPSSVDAGPSPRKSPRPSARDMSSSFAPTSPSARVRRLSACNALSTADIAPSPIRRTPRSVRGALSTAGVAPSSVHLAPRFARDALPSLGAALPQALPVSSEGGNPYPRPYGGGWRNDPYHLWDRVQYLDPNSSIASCAPLLPTVDVETPTPRLKKGSSHNYYGGRSAAQRESTRDVIKTMNANRHAYTSTTSLQAPDSPIELDDLSPDSPIELDDLSPEPFVSTAVSLLQRGRKGLKVRLVKARDPAGNTYFYEQAHVPRYTKHSMRPSKRFFSIRNFLSRRLYGKPGDGTSLLMPNIPLPPDIYIPGVDKLPEEMIIAQEKEAEEMKAKEKELKDKESKEREPQDKKEKEKEHPFGSLDWLDHEIRLRRRFEKRYKAEEEARIKAKKKATRFRFGNSKAPAIRMSHDDYEYDPRGVDALVPTSPAGFPSLTRWPKFRSGAAPAYNRILRRNKADCVAIAQRGQSQRQFLEQQREREQLDSSRARWIEEFREQDELKKQAALEEEKRLERAAKAEKMLEEQRLKDLELDMLEESLDITPPRLRTPKRSMIHEFDDHEPLIAPKSPQQRQFEADQAADAAKVAIPVTPRTPVHVPVLEEIHETVEDDGDGEKVEKTNEGDEEELGKTDEHSVEIEETESEKEFRQCAENVAKLEIYR
ncbi:hypothetical protein D6D10_00664 [Aureobasidium pullulans]|uniref:Uncharacterized protein n=1 Tax=Aureobasidium pullulans TaxID=5580 RepID=A0A4S9FCS8_AURPU|nr:hypothetical protein D6D10_00664 [Aureobasidium pullulans]